MNRRNRTKAKRIASKIGQGIKLVLKLTVFLILLTVIIGIIYFYNTYGKVIMKYQMNYKNDVHVSKLFTVNNARQHKDART